MTWHQGKVRELKNMTEIQDEKMAQLNVREKLVEKEVDTLQTEDSEAVVNENVH